MLRLLALAVLALVCLGEPGDAAAVSQQKKIAALKRGPTAKAARARAAQRKSRKASNTTSKTRTRPRTARADEVASGKARVYKKTLTAADQRMVAIARTPSFGTAAILDTFLRGRFLFGDASPGYMGSKAQTAIRGYLDQIRTVARRGGYEGDVFTGMFELGTIGAGRRAPAAGYIVEVLTGVDRFTRDGRGRERVTGRRMFFDAGGTRVVERRFSVEYAR